jgi:hypothetical protein
VRMHRGDGLKSYHRLRTYFLSEYTHISSQRKAFFLSFPNFRQPFIHIFVFT